MVAGITATAMADTDEWLASLWRAVGNVKNNGPELLA
jgi:hypothetical protein